MDRTYKKKLWGFYKDYFYKMPHRKYKRWMKKNLTKRLRRKIKKRSFDEQFYDDVYKL